MRGILTRTAHTHGTRGDYIFLLSPPDPLRGIRMKRIKRMRPKKGATFLPERYYLSRSLQPPFSGNKHQYVTPSSGYLLSHRNHGNHGKCLRHGLRSGSEAKISVISVNFCVTYIFPRAKIICEICVICVTKKLPYYLAVWEIVRNFAAETC